MKRSALWLYPAPASNIACSLHHSHDAGRPNPPSAVNLKGRWLEECGLSPGCQLS
ncbi:SymE family type I addiction module toxin [Pectobacterium parmentieri]|uniref:SymE family type I addiction module toxin n=1 Tax=Pectobacterium parmentieri TaxID=1905730 RepID=UPI002B1D9163|nr:SymE family type I addiction module toxin [Pectobacterium parmentieri]